MQASALPFRCLVSSNMESDLFSLFIYGMVVPVLIFLEPPISSQALILFCHYFCHLGPKLQSIIQAKHWKIWLNMKYGIEFLIHLMSAFFFLYALNRFFPVDTSQLLCRMYWHIYSLLCFFYVFCFLYSSILFFCIPILTISCCLATPRMTPTR